MDERGMTLLTDWNGEDLSGWFISEKYNGCRAYWDGRRFWTRGGNIIKAPEWFTEALPDNELDGEIFAGYGQFEKARLAVQCGKFIKGEPYRFMIFDRPDVSGPWNMRMQRTAAGRYSKPVEIVKASRMTDIEKTFTAIKIKGGEGLVLRNPAVLRYERCRTANTVRMV